MRAFRRGVVAMVLGALGGIVFRLKGSHGSVPQAGAWRELAGDDFR